MRNSSSLDWLRFMHTPNDYRVSPVYPAITIREVTKKDVVLLPYVIKAHHKPTYSMAAHHVSI